MLRPAVALVLLVAFAALGFGWRTVLQVRRHGDSGWRFERSGADRVVAPALAGGFLLLAVGPALAMWAANGLLFGLSVFLMWRASGADAQPPQTMTCDG